MTAQRKNKSQPPGQPVFHKVAENLYRLESSGGYYALVKRAGKQFRRSLKTKDRKLAERRLTNLKAKIGALRISDDADLNFGQLAHYWNEATKHTIAGGTLKRRTTCIKNLAEFFKNASIRNIEVRDCEQWAANRGSEVAAQTFAHELDTMKSVFKYALSHRLLLSNPAAGIKRKKISNRRIQTPSREQFQQIVAEIRKSDGRSDSQEKAKDGADLIEFLAYSGARLGEAHAARWQDTDFRTGEIWIHGVKSEASDRLMPMPRELRAFLERMKATAKPQPTDLIISIKSAKRSLGRACRELGFPHFTHHDFRHYFATTCIEEGVDIPTVSRWLGHGDGGALAMQRYGHLRREHSLAMMKRVSFSPKPDNIVPLPQSKGADTNKDSPATADQRRAIAKAKAKYGYPWWASENPLEVFWGQIQEQISIVPIPRFLEVAKQAMGREVFKLELNDRQALVDEFRERVSETTLNELVAKIPARKQDDENGQREAAN
jgi:integrase